MDRNWNSRINNLLSQLSTLFQVSIALGFQPTHNTVIDNIISTKDITVDSFVPPVYNFTIFETIFPCRKDDILRRLFVVMYCFYRPHLVKLKEKFQNTLAIYASLDVDRWFEGRNGALCETGKTDRLLSMDQIFSLTSALNKLQSLRAQCLDMINRLLEIITIEKKEEQEFAMKFIFPCYLIFRNPSGIMYNQYFEQLETWIQAVVNTINSQNESILMCYSQLDQLQKIFSNENIDKKSILACSSPSPSSLSSSLSSSSPSRREVCEDAVQKRALEIRNRIQFIIQSIRQRIAKMESNTNYSNTSSYRSMSFVLQSNRALVEKGISRVKKTKDDLEHLSTEVNDLTKVLQEWESKLGEFSISESSKETRYRFESIVALNKLYTSCADYTDTWSREYDSLWKSVNTIFLDFVSFRERNLNSRLQTLNHLPAPMLIASSPQAVQLSTVNPSISTVNPSISTVNPSISTVNPSISTVNPSISTASTSLSTASKSSVSISNATNATTTATNATTNATTTATNATVEPTIKTTSTNLLAEECCEEAREESRKSQRCPNGWVCVICGIVNEHSKVVCDGCNQRHI